MDIEQRLTWGSRLRALKSYLAPLMDTLLPDAQMAEAMHDALWLATNQGVGEAPSLLRYRARPHYSNVRQD